ncbi:MAG: MXAN_5808 family serine peptidase [Myxococcota bacterium]|nr:MXAN_5808 family serine peptidase [Myxococcota bacterium]
MLKSFFLVYLIANSFHPLLGAMSPHEEARQLRATEQLSWAILELTKGYVKPARFKPKEMVVHSLRSVESVVPELIFDETKLPGQVHLQLTGAPPLTIAVERMGSIWEAFMTLKQSLDYVAKHLPRDVKAQEIELKAINGMLETLDPHSVMFSPQEYEEMKVSTQGQFGGLGIVIGQRDGWLTVISPIPDTPASKAGIRAHDQIIRINDETTENMSLEEAVSRLRGKPGTNVVIQIRRKGAQRPIDKELTRRIIKVRSVSHKVLRDGIGYLRLKSFRENTTDEAVSALARMRQAGATRGLILDLRDNPGGLLEQAVSISDLFLDKGVIVTTEGFGDQMSQPRYAHAAGSLTDLPIVVLLSAGSASASEIVAGALRNHGRALLLGEQSFGKGSVQTIIPFRPRRTKVEGTALKLTIAHYLTPGGVSIQGTGIVPDIHLQAAQIDEDFIALRPSGTTRESDLNRSLDHASTQSQKVRSMISYLAEETMDQDEQTRQESAGEVSEDFEIRLAQRLLLSGGAADADQFYDRIRGELDRVGGEQDELITAALKGQGIVWNAAPDESRGAQGVATLGFTGEAKAGESVELELCVQNTSDQDLYRVQGRTVSAHGLMNDLEFIVGYVAARKRACQRRNVELSESQLTRKDYVSLQVDAEGGLVTTPAPTGLNFLPQKRPTLDYHVSVLDESDGLVSPGETVKLRVDVTAQNHPAGSLLVALRNRNGSAVKLVGARRRHELLQPGESWSAELSFEARNVTEALEFDLTVGATKEGVWHNDRVVLPVVANPSPTQSCTGRLLAKPGAMLRQGGSLQSQILDTINKATAFKCLGRSGSWWRVSDDRGRLAYVAGAEGQIQQSSTPVGTIETMRRPPEIKLTDNLSNFEVAGATLPLKALVSSNQPIKHILVYRRSETGRKKVALVGGGGLTSTLDLEVPLEPGHNLISIQALQGVAYGASKSFWVLSRQGWDPKLPTKHHRSHASVNSQK